MVRRVYAPYGFDWRGIDKDEPSTVRTVRCTKCDRSFSTRHCLRRVIATEELVSYFFHLCPGCDSLDYVFGVSSPIEIITLRG